MRKFTRIGSLLMLICFTIALVRYIAIGSENQFSIRKALNEVEEHGNFFEYNDFWIDAQKVKWSFTSLTNALKAQNGESYTEWTWHTFSGGGYPGGSETVIDKEGKTIGYFAPSTQTKPTYNNVMEWIEYIGNFISYIGRFLVAIGEILVDTFLCVINAIFTASYLLYYICFKP